MQILTERVSMKSKTEKRGGTLPPSALLTHAYAGLAFSESLT